MILRALKNGVTELTPRFPMCSSLLATTSELRCVAVYNDAIFYADRFALAVLKSLQDSMKKTRFFCFQKTSDVRCQACFGKIFGKLGFLWFNIDFFGKKLVIFIPKLVHFNEKKLTKPYLIRPLCWGGFLDFTGGENWGQSKGWFVKCPELKIFGDDESFQEN